MQSPLLPMCSHIDRKPVTMIHCRTEEVAVETRAHVILNEHYSTMSRKCLFVNRQQMEDYTK